MNQIINTYGPLLLGAMGQTLLLALCGLFFGCILGIFFGLASVVDNKVSRTIAKIYVNLIRGVPMIVAEEAEAPAEVKEEKPKRTTKPRTTGKKKNVK